MLSTAIWFIQTNKQAKDECLDCNCQNSVLRYKICICLSPSTYDPASLQMILLLHNYVLILQSTEFGTTVNITYKAIKTGCHLKGRSQI